MGETRDSPAATAAEKSSDTAEAAPDAKKLSRRRTKTGCLTCRKRRIKCGEEHPICNNCIKSKRECEGYKQPVIFKQPAGEYHHIDHSSTAANFGLPYSAGHPLGFLPHLAASDGNNHLKYDPAWTQANPEGDFQSWAHGQQRQLHGFDPSSLHGRLGWSNSSAGAYVPEQNPGHNQHMEPYDWQRSAAPANFAGPSPSSAGTTHPLEGNYWPPPQFVPPQPGAHYYSQSRGSGFTEAYLPGSGFRQLNTSTQFEDIPVVPSSVPVKRESTSPVGNEQRYSSYGFVQQPSFNTVIPTVPIKHPPKTQLPLAPDDDDDDDEEDPWDVELDFADAESVPLGQSQHDLNSILVKFAANNQRRSRTFTTFLDGPSILTTYRPSISASPLNDEKVARIFCHFITVTGPCLSVFERQASQSTMTFSNSPIPTPQKTLWTYTLPSIALHHPALLHAILALGALHISKIQETSEDPAIKHYTYAVRRIGKLLGLPKRRHETATLAANLLVGFYEVMSSDHSRWNVHLAGAKVLVMEFDFAKKTRIIRDMRSRARRNIAGKPAMSYEEWLHIVGIPESLLDDKDWEIDEALVSNLTGYHVEYDRQHQPNFPPKEHLPDFTARDIEEYKTQSDLYWWYCKQDVFQSMVSGDALLMPYRRWIYCPPRGQIGKPDAAYATMDHLVLIMARLTDFGGKDRVRKVKMVKAQGGQWRPPPHFFGHNKPPPMPPAPIRRSSSPSQGRPTISTDVPNTSRKGSQTNINHIGQHDKVSPTAPAPPPPSGPGFYGMMPMPTDPIEMHSAFYAMNANIHDQAFHDTMPDEESVHSSNSQTLEDDTAAALKEHSEIIKSFDLFFNSLGESYQPLAADSCPAISTPFGPALQYRTYPIACVWAFYYVGRILIHRFQPYMPPAAMVAAGVSAHLTAEYAQQVGRICAGLYYPQQYSLQTGNLNPTLGAALMESTFCLLFAAVQFHDASQRGWTISKLRDISQKTGWQTAAAIAAACEVSWEKMGEAGKGPPYRTTMDRNNNDMRVRRKNKLSGGNMNEEEDDEHAGPGLPRHDRSAIHTNQSTRVHWALGLLSVETDIEKLNLDRD